MKNHGRKGQWVGKFRVLGRSRLVGVQEQGLEVEIVGRCASSHEEGKMLSGNARWIAAAGARPCPS